MANIVLDFLHNYDVGERRESEPANAYQYDEGHVLEAIVPTQVTSCEIHYWMRDMTEAEAYVPSSITANSDGSYTILGNIPNSYFENDGELNIYLVVTDDNTSITKYEGSLFIDQRPMPDDYVDDNPTNGAVNIVTAATEAAEAAEAWAVGKINGVDVPSTADQYENNSKYYADEAATVAASIPADYSALSTQVGTNTSAITSLTQDLTAIDAVLDIDTSGIVFVDSVEDMTDYSKTYVLTSNYHIYEASGTTTHVDEFEVDQLNYRIYKNSPYGTTQNGYFSTTLIPFTKADKSATITLVNAINLVSRYGTSYYGQSKVGFYNSSRVPLLVPYISNRNSDNYLYLPADGNDLVGTITSNSTLLTAFEEIEDDVAYIAFCWCIEDATKSSVPEASLASITQSDVDAMGYKIYISTHDQGTYSFVDTGEVYDFSDNALTAVSNRVTAIENTIATSESIITRNRDVEDIARYSSEYGVGYGGTANYYKQCSMLITTDLHSCWEQFNSAITYLNYLDTLDMGACLGDIVVERFTNDSTSYNTGVAASTKPFLTVIGNHDCGNSTTPSYCGTTAEVVTKFITPNESKAGQSGLTVPYYAYTDTDHEIVFIVLYDYDSPESQTGGVYDYGRGTACYSQTQIDWLISALASVPSGYGVVILKHAYFEPNGAVECNWTQWNQSYISPITNNGGYGAVQILSEIIHAWQNGTSFSGTFAPTSSSVLPTLSISCDFSSRGSGEFICYIVGHLHKDIIAKNTKYNDQIIIGLPATAHDEWQNANSDLPRVTGKKSEDAITVVSFDRRWKKINLVRIGSNKTVDMVDRTMYSIAYG